MPTYEFKCHDCGHEFERMLKMADYKLPESEPCPNCGEYKVTRHITANGLSAMKTHYGLDDARKKLPSEFKETMNLIKKGNPGSTIKGF